MTERTFYMGGRGGGVICYYDRNDELFRLLEKQCTEGLYGGEKVEGCAVEEDGDGSRIISIDSYQPEIGPVTIEARREFDAKAPHLPPRTRFSLFAGETCEADGGNRVELPEYRICEDPENGDCTVFADVFSNVYLRAFRTSIEAFLGRFLAYGYLDDDQLESDELVFEGRDELDGVQPDLQQVHPTSVVRNFASEIDFQSPLEGIMEQFKAKFARISNYHKTPFAERGWGAPDLFVCRRSAHEIFATGYMFGCGEYATAWMAVLKSAGMESRLIKVVGSKFKGHESSIGHDVVEVRDPGTGEWVLTDPTMGKIHRNYKGEDQFIAYAHRWIKMGTWQSNWEAGCFDKMDNTRMRAEAMEKNYTPDAPFVSLDGTEPKD